MTKEKLTKIILKQKRANPRGFRLGEHIIKIGAPQEFMFSEKDMKEFKGVGPQAWLSVVTKEDMAAMPKSNEENRKQLADKKKK